MSTPSRFGYLRELVGGMAERRTNVALLLLTAVALGTGAGNFAAGTGWVAPVTVAHGMAGLGIILLSGWKWQMVRRGMAVRPARSTWPSVLLGVAAVTALVTGLLHASGSVRWYGPLRDMQVHVGAGLSTIPLTIWHVFARGNLPQRSDLSRRNLMRSALLIGSTGALYAGLERLWTVAGLPGAGRRATGSYPEGDHDPDRMPSIIWLFDPRLDLDAKDWSLTIRDADGSRTLAYEDLRPFGERRTAVLDCTSGWYAEQDWHGAPLERLVRPAAEHRSLLVRSRTGYWRRFPLRDLPHLLLATGYEGRDLAPEHGFPARLVAPGRRGFWWVKWVTYLEVDDTPWWRQPPYPLQ